MPIRFRCAYCNQLMGIARRKSGSVVRCPKCAGEVIVPVAHEPQAANVPAGLNQMFEAADFGKEFANLGAQPDPLPNPLLPPPPYGHPPLLESQPRAEPPAASLVSVSLSAETPPASRSLTRPGVFLTTPLLVAAGAALLVAIAAAFLLGFFLGRATLH